MRWGENLFFATSALSATEEQPRVNHTNSLLYRLSVALLKSKQSSGYSPFDNWTASKLGPQLIGWNLKPIIHVSHIGPEWFLNLILAYSRGEYSVHISFQKFIFEFLTARVYLSLFMCISQSHLRHEISSGYIHTFLLAIHIYNQKKKFL